LETLTAKLSKNLVVSEDIARHTTAPLDDLGLHELKGVPTPSRAFSPRS
jgi:hypothetical protein